MVRMKMRHHDMVQCIMRNASLSEAVALPHAHSQKAQGEHLAVSARLMRVAQIQSGRYPCQAA